LAQFLLQLNKTFIMTDDKNKTESAEQKPNDNEQEPLTVHNPFNKNDDKKITQEDVDNEQTFKEAQTERD
jgi:hypothetical protein